MNVARDGARSAPIDNVNERHVKIKSRKTREKKNTRAASRKSTEESFEDVLENFNGLKLYSQTRGAPPGTEKPIISESGSRAAGRQNGTLVSKAAPKSSGSIKAQVAKQSEVFEGTLGTMRAERNVAENKNAKELEVSQTPRIALSEAKCTIEPDIALTGTDRKNQAVQRALATLKEYTSVSSIEVTAKQSACSDIETRSEATRKDLDASPVGSMVKGTEELEKALSSLSIAARSDAPQSGDGLTSNSMQPISSKQESDELYIGHGVLQLRDYQVSLVNEVVKKFNSGAPSVLFYLPTGGGKTAVAACIAKSLNKSRTGIFVHRHELANQMLSALLTWGFAARDIGLFNPSASLSKVQSTVTVFSIQTFASRFIRTDRLAKQRPVLDLIIIDEAHHAMADEYLALTQMYPDAILLGLTATPFRLKRGELLGDIFYGQVRGPSIGELITQKWLVAPVFVRSVMLERTTLEPKEIREKATINDIMRRWKKRYASRRTLVFCIDVAHANTVVEVCEELGIEARTITGMTSPEERAALFQASKINEVKLLCSVDVVSEGVDTTWIDCLIFLRPTTSKSLFIQQIGRGLRPYEGKDHCVVLDEVGNVFRHGFVTDVVSRWSKNISNHIYSCVRTNCTSLVDKGSMKCFFCAKQNEMLELRTHPVAD